MKLENDKIEEDPDLQTEKEAVELIKSLYPKIKNKRNAKQSEAVKTIVTQNTRKRQKLDRPRDEDVGVLEMGTKVNSLPVSDQFIDQEIPKINLHSKINLQTCGQNNIATFDCMDPPTSPVCDHNNVAIYDRTKNEMSRFENSDKSDKKAITLLRLNSSATEINLRGDSGVVEQPDPKYSDNKLVLSKRCTKNKTVCFDKKG